MNQLASLRSFQITKIVRTSHFWITIALTGIVIGFYYTWLDWFPWFWSYFVFEYTNYIIGIPFILIPFLYASIVFWWRGSLVVWIVSLVALLPLLMHFYPLNISSLFRNVAFLFVPIVMITIIALELYWREKQKTIMAEREEERQIYMSQIFKAQEDERRRIAQELHDDTTQELLVLANSTQNLVTASADMNNMEMKEKAEWIRDRILKVSEGVRRLSLDLRPSVLDDIGLVPALRWLAERMVRETNIGAKIITRGAIRNLQSETEVIIFRMIQEALNNVRRHSNATEAVVTLKFDTTSLKITVRDNGKGFSLSKTLSTLTSDGKLGIIGMQQRAQLINGTVDIQSQSGRGTSISIALEDHSDVPKY